MTIIARRTEMLSLKSKGINLNSLVSELSVKYKCTEKVLIKDWETLGEWAPQLLELQKQNMLYIIFQGFWVIVREAWCNYDLNKTESFRIAFLKLAKETYREMLGIRQDLSSLKLKTLEIKQSVGVDVEHVKHVLKEMTPEQLRRLTDELSIFKSARK